MKKSYITGRNHDFYDKGKKMFDRIQALPEHQAMIQRGVDRTTPPQRHLESTTDMMMELADRLGELPDDIDPRAWSHLLVYAPKPKPCPTCEALARTVMLDQTSHDTKRPWVGLTDEEANLLWENTDDRDSWELIKRVESKLKERNK